MRRMFVNFWTGVVAGLGKWLGRLMPPCAHIAQALSESLDHPLAPMRWMAVFLHVRMCLLCRRYQRQLRVLRATLRAYAGQLGGTPAVALPTLSSEAKQRLKAAMQRKV